jgi:hypothetical protein
MSFPRIAGLAGLTGALLWAISFTVLPPPPGVGASPREVLEFASENHTSLFVGVYTIDVLPALAYLMLGVGLWIATREDRGWGILGLVSSVSLAIAVLTWGVTDGLLAVQGKEGASLATIGDTFQWLNATHVPAHASIAMLVLAYGLAGRRVGLLPSWATPLTVFASASALVVIPAGFFESDPLEVVHQLSVFAFFGWVVLASVGLLRSERAPARMRSTEPVVSS